MFIYNLIFVWFLILRREKFKKFVKKITISFFIYYYIKRIIFNILYIRKFYQEAISINPRKQILWITQTAMLLGLTVAAQYFITGMLSFNQYASQLAVGSLVNLFLILATLTCGFFSGFSIAALTPVISFSIGRMPHVLMIPFVALGNLTIVFVFWLICRKNIFGQNFTINWAFAAIAGSIFKFIILWLGVTKIFINFILINDAALNPPQIAKMTTLISFNYSFPQLATALIGCVLVYAIYPVVKKAVIDKTDKTEKTLNEKN